MVCRDEDDIHYLIEYFRHCGSKAQSSMVHALIGTVLPSVQKSSERVIIYSSAFQISCARKRFSKLKNSEVTKIKKIPRI